MPQPSRAATQTHSAWKWKLTLQELERAPLLEEVLWQLEHLQSLSSLKDRDEQTKGFELFFTSQASEKALLQQLEEILAPLNLINSLKPATFETVLEDDWANAWKIFWKPKRILEHLVIQPSWEPFTPLENDIVLKLDPKTAFGTGEHETTQLMLHAMDGYLTRRKGFYPTERLIDVGTGSGILALYAAKLGIPNIIAIDNDPQTQAIAEENLEENNLSTNAIQFETHTLESWQKANPNHTGFNLICANILLPVLVDLMPHFIETLAPKGLVMMSGLLKTQFNQLKLAIDEACLETTTDIKTLEIKNLYQLGDWIAVVCQLKTTSK